MPDDGAERTEAPTPRRRTEARNNGQVARSQDLGAVVISLAGMLLLEFTGPDMCRRIMRIMHLAFGGDYPTDGGDLAAFTMTIMKEIMFMLIPMLLVVFAASVVVNYMQVGFLVTSKPLVPSLNRLNPLSGLKRLVSPRTFVMALMNLFKLGFATTIAVLSVMQMAPQIMAALAMENVIAYSMLGDMVFSLSIRLLVAMLVLALFDYAYQKYKHEQDLKMTKEEVKEEMKSMEGDPMLKRRRRQAQLQLANQRIQAAVPQSDVVITNPTHLSIALKYDPDSMDAPKVTAKGADYLAMRIRLIASANGVPIVERKELARAMYDVVEPGQEIPEDFYKAVAEVLAYVYEMAGRGMRPQPVPVGS